MASDAETGKDDRRDDERKSIELRVEYKRLNTFFADYTKNISRGGTFIRTDRPLPIGTEFVFKLHVPSLEILLELHGEVQWTVSIAEAKAGKRGQNEPGMGIRFIYRDQAEEDAVLDLVEKMMVESLGSRIYQRLMADRDAAVASDSKTPADDRSDNNPDDQPDD